MVLYLFIDAALLIGGHRNLMTEWNPTPQGNIRSFQHLPENVFSASRATILGDTIYHCGGSQQGKSKLCFKASVLGGSWSRIEDMKVGRWGHTLTTVGNSIVATVGTTSRLASV